MRRALVTGGSSGLGAAIVDNLVARGFVVVSVDRRFMAARPGVTVIECDLADRAAVDRTLPALLAAGPFEIVVLNAGVSATGAFEAAPFDAYRRLMIVNAETPLVLAAALVAHRAVARRLCFVSSLSHFTGYPGAAVYAASKDVVAAYAASVRRPFARLGVAVTLACPGPLDTAHAERHAPAGADRSKRMAPDIAAAVILEAVLAGRRLVVPGRTARMAAIMGRLFPERTTRLMRRLIFERLKAPVW